MVGNTQTPLNPILEAIYSDERQACSELRDDVNKLIGKLPIGLYRVIRDGYPLRVDIQFNDGQITTINDDPNPIFRLDDADRTLYDNLNLLIVNNTIPNKSFRAYADSTQTDKFILFCNSEGSCNCLSTKLSKTLTLNVAEAIPQGGGAAEA